MIKENGLNFGDRHVAVIGSGIAGLTAADELARWGIRVTVVEKSERPGGHAAQFSCKAVDECVRCGACLVQDRLQRIAQQKRITLLTGTRVVGIRHNGEYEMAYASDGPGSARKRTGTLKADALLLAVGFSAADPSAKPYGYGKFANVITNLDAERRLRARGELTRPSDGRPPGRIAFIQCVGSRDSRIGHNWCSKICCPSALRMARLVQKRQPDTEVTFFYIDVQSFGRNFQAYYHQCRDRIQTVRAIPGDILKQDDNSLQVIYFDPQQAASIERTVDLVVLSVGMAPSIDNAALTAMLGRRPAPDGFLGAGDTAKAELPGLFTAGAARGPMSIAESIDSAGKAVWDIVRFLDERGQGRRQDESVGMDSRM